MMEEGGSDVVEVSEESKKAASQFVVPHLDFVVISSRYKQRLLFVEINSSDGAIMLVKLVNQCAHPIVPQLDDSVV